jgi:translation initiation factor 2 beta subunit (eIF-2beta)/eIF-5
MHKGYTPFSWALNSVSQGDDIVFVSRDQVYKLQGDKDNLLKFMSAKVRVTGNLDGSTLVVERIGRAAKNE